MTNEKLFSLIAKYQSNLNSQDLAIVTNYLKDKEDEHFLSLHSFPLLNPIIGFIYSWFFPMFGIGAFYAKKTYFSVFQFISYVFFMCIYLGYPLYYGSDIDEIIDFWLSNRKIGYGYFFFSLSFTIYITLFLIGITNVQKWIKDYNFKKLIEYLISL